MHKYDHTSKYLTRKGFFIIFSLICVILLTLLFVLVSDIPAEAVRMCAGCVGH